MLKVLISAPDESNWTDYGRLQTNAKIPKQQLFRRRLMFTRVSQPHGDGATIWWQAAHAIGAPPQTRWRWHPVAEVNCRGFYKEISRDIEKSISWPDGCDGNRNSSQILAEAKVKANSLKGPIEMEKFPNFKSDLPPMQ